MLLQDTTSYLPKLFEKIPLRPMDFGQFGGSYSPNPFGQSTEQDDQLNTMLNYSGDLSAFRDSTDLSSTMSLSITRTKRSSSFSLANENNELLCNPIALPAGYTNASLDNTDYHSPEIRPSPNQKSPSSPVSVNTIVYSPNSLVQSSKDISRENTPNRSDHAQIGGSSPNSTLSEGFVQPNSGPANVPSGYISGQGQSQGLAQDSHTKHTHSFMHPRQSFSLLNSDEFGNDAFPCETTPTTKNIFSFGRNASSTHAGNNSSGYGIQNERTDLLSIANPFYPSSNLDQPTSRFQDSAGFDSGDFSASKNQEYIPHLNVPKQFPDGSIDAISRNLLHDNIFLPAVITSDENMSVKAQKSPPRQSSNTSQSTHSSDRESTPLQGPIDDSEPNSKPIKSSKIPSKVKAKPSTGVSQADSTILSKSIAGISGLPTLDSTPPSSDLSLLVSASSYNQFSTGLASLYNQHQQQNLSCQVGNTMSAAGMKEHQNSNQGYDASPNVEGSHSENGSVRSAKNGHKKPLSPISQSGRESTMLTDDNPSASSQSNLRRSQRTRSNQVSPNNPQDSDSVEGDIEGDNLVRFHESSQGISNAFATVNSTSTGVMHPNVATSESASMQTISDLSTVLSLAPRRTGRRGAYHSPTLANQNIGDSNGFLSDLQPGYQNESGSLPLPPTLTPSSSHHLQRGFDTDKKFPRSADEYSQINGASQFHDSSSSVSSVSTASTGSYPSLAQPIKKKSTAQSKKSSQDQTFHKTSASTDSGNISEKYQGYGGNAFDGSATITHAHDHSDGKNNAIGIRQSSVHNPFSSHGLEGRGGQYPSNSSGFPAMHPYSSEEPITVAVDLDDCVVQVPFVSTEKLLYDMMQNMQYGGDSNSMVQKNDKQPHTAPPVEDNRPKKRAKKGVVEDPKDVKSKSKTAKGGKNSKQNTTENTTDNDNYQYNPDESVFLQMATRQAAALTPIPADIEADGDIEVKRERNKNSAAQYRRRRKLYLDILEKRVRDMERSLLKKAQEINQIHVREVTLNEQLRLTEDKLRYHNQTLHSREKELERERAALLEKNNEQAEKLRLAEKAMETLRYQGMNRHGDSFDTHPHQNFAYSTHPSHIPSHGSQLPPRPISHSHQPMGQSMGQSMGTHPVRHPPNVQTGHNTHNHTNPHPHSHSHPHSHPHPHPHSYPPPPPPSHSHPQSSQNGHIHTTMHGHGTATGPSGPSYPMQNPPQTNPQMYHPQHPLPLSSASNSQQPPSGALLATNPPSNPSSAPTSDHPKLAASDTFLPLHRPQELGRSRPFHALGSSSPSPTSTSTPTSTSSPVRGTELVDHPNSASLSGLSPNLSAIGDIDSLDSLSNLMSQHIDPLKPSLLDDLALAQQESDNHPGSLFAPYPSYNHPNFGYLDAPQPGFDIRNSFYTNSNHAIGTASSAQPHHVPELRNHGNGHPHSHGHPHNHPHGHSHALAHNHSHSHPHSHLHPNQLNHNHSHSHFVPNSVVNAPVPMLGDEGSNPTGSISPGSSNTSSPKDSSASSRGIRIGSLFAILSCILLTVFVPVSDPNGNSLGTVASAFLNSFTGSGSSTSPQESIPTQNYDATFTVSRAMDGDVGDTFSHHTNHDDLTDLSGMLTDSAESAVAAVYDSVSSAASVISKQISRRVLEASGFSSTNDFDMELLNLFGISSLPREFSLKEIYAAAGRQNNTLFDSSTHTAFTKANLSHQNVNLSHQNSQTEPSVDDASLSDQPFISTKSAMSFTVYSSISIVALLLRLVFYMTVGEGLLTLMVFILAVYVITFWARRSRFSQIEEGDISQVDTGFSPESQSNDQQHHLKTAPPSTDSLPESTGFNHSSNASNAGKSSHHLSDVPEGHVVVRLHGNLYTCPAHYVPLLRDQIALAKKQAELKKMQEIQRLANDNYHEVLRVVQQSMSKKSTSNDIQPQKGIRQIERTSENLLSSNDSTIEHPSSLDEDEYEYTYEDEDEDDFDCETSQVSTKDSHLLEQSQ